MNGLGLLVLTLPEKMNVQLGEPRAHKMASVSAVEHQVTILVVILYCWNKLPNVCGMA